MQKLYAGLDLHSSNVYAGIIDEQGTKHGSRRLPCNLFEVLKYFSKFNKSEMKIAVESTYNWYWLVDGLQADGYNVVLANPGAMKQYNGIKHTDDKTDAFFIAELLRLNILPEGHIYPVETRYIRDLLRRRQTFVQQRTTHLLSLKSAVQRNCAETIKRSILHMLTEEFIDSLIAENRNPILNFTLKQNLKAAQSLSTQIDDIEKVILAKVDKSMEFIQLNTVPGIGKILGMTIMLETGNINRFAQVGNYTSYCRCTSSKCSSNGKKKGENNRKNGNKYLSWALVEVANQAIIHYKEPNQFYQRKSAKKNQAVAIKAIAAKMSKAIYYMLKNKQEFDMKRVFP
ncbi:MAG: IS110 family transposase [Victivallales bacterium]|nr:IS110 family transposase [Victivallales bacterium]